MQADPKWVASFDRARLGWTHEQLLFRAELVLNGYNYGKYVHTFLIMHPYNNAYANRAALPG